jgi:hypothetical protein
MECGAVMNDKDELLLHINLACQKVVKKHVTFLGLNEESLEKPEE